MVKMTTCPCCKGEKYLYVFDEKEMDREPMKYSCNHCQGKGEVPCEVDDVGHD